MKHGSQFFERAPPGVGLAGGLVETLGPPHFRRDLITRLRKLAHASGAEGCVGPAAITFRFRWTRIARQFTHDRSAFVHGVVLYRNGHRTGHRAIDTFSRCNCLKLLKPSCASRQMVDSTARLPRLARSICTRICTRPNRHPALCAPRTLETRSLRSRLDGCGGRI